MTAGHEHHGGHDGHDDHDDHGTHPPGIQHHYDDAQHQFDAGKLGIWFFLAQEVLFFSALFVAYVLYRHHRPEIFAYAHHYLDVKWGAINTAVLIISSLSAAWAVRCAQLAQRRGLIACLAITIVCAFGFLGIKYIEYAHKVHENILFGAKFDPCISSGGQHLLTNGNHCPGTKRSACRAPNIDLRADQPGWQVACKVNELKVSGSGEAKVEQSRRELPVCEMESHHHGPAHAVNPPCWEIAQNPWVCKVGDFAGTPGVAALVHYGDQAERGNDVEIELTCEDAKPAPAPDFTAELPETTAVGKATFTPKDKLSPHDVGVQRSMGPPPSNTNMFFSIYFCMTGLHGIHVLAGIIVCIWLLIRAVKGHFTPQYFGPVDYFALYWHLVDLIWIFLFPLLYLIH